MRAKVKKTLETIGNPSNGAAETISFEQPYSVMVTIKGSAPLLLHGWNCEAVAEKAAAKKGSKAKKEDDLESYVYRNDKGEICLPGQYLLGSIVGAAKFIQDPRSPRKSAMDLFKAGVISETTLASLGSKDWDYLDRRRVVIQRNAVTRQRPAFKEGWRTTFQLCVLVPEYISETLLHETLVRAGRLIGVGDFRPSFGRFLVSEFKRLG